MWFVVWTGNIKQDPLDEGIDYFTDIMQATEFAERYSNKGFICTIYQGIHYRDVL